MYSARKIIDKEEKSYPLFKKILIFGVIILLPVVIVMVLFSPLAKNSVNPIKLEKYALPAPFTREAVDTILSRMSDDQEFSYYFEVLEPGDIEDIKETVFNELKDVKGKEEHLRTITRGHKLAESSATLFYNLDFDEDYYRTPEAYPEHQRIMTQFMKNEFSVAVIGLIYKATYDVDFVFQWGKESIKAAQLFREVNNKLTAR